MNHENFIHNLERFYRQKTALINPVITLDWVNTTGWESEIYAHTVIHGTPNQRQAEQRVMRLLTGADFEEARSEFRMLSLLYRAGYPVPEAYSLGLPGDGFDRSFIIMQRVEGGDFASRFPKSPDEDQTALREFISLFRRLHTLNWQPYVDHPKVIDPPDRPFFHFDRKLSLFSHHLKTSGLAAFEPVMAWLWEKRVTVPCEGASVVHQDFHYNNILEDQNGKLFVVDWTSAEISDYRFDLAWTLALALAYGGKARWEMILAEYERQMGGKVPGLEMFEVAALVRRIGSAMLSMQVGADKLGMRQEAVEIMRKDREAFERLFQRLSELTDLKLTEIEIWMEGLG